MKEGWETDPVWDVYERGEKAFSKKTLSYLFQVSVSRVDTGKTY